MQHCHFKTLSLRQLTLYYIEMRKVLFIIVLVGGMMSLYAQSLKLNKHFEDSDKKTLIRTAKNVAMTFGPAYVPYFNGAIISGIKIFSKDIYGDDRP